MAYIGGAMKAATKERIAPVGQAGLSPENRAMVRKFREQVEGQAGYIQAKWTVEQIGGDTVAVTIEAAANEINADELGKFDNVCIVSVFHGTSIEVLLNPDADSHLGQLKRAQSQVNDFLFKQNKERGYTGETMGDASNNTFDDSRLGRLQARFEKRMREIELPSEGFTTKEQAAAAARLSTTLAELRKVQAELGLPVMLKPERVRQAERLRMEYVRHHNKTGEVIPVRPRGRPRRQVAPAA